MSPAQKEAYEEGKLKMRKALADPDLIDEMEEVIVVSNSAGVGKIRILL